MRFVAAIVAFVIAFGMIAYGFAQRTVLAAPSTLTASVSTDSPATVTLIDSKTLQSLPGRQKIDISGSSTVFAAYGRTEDVKAWVGKTTYNRIGYKASTQKLTNTVVEGKATKVPNPAGSDLWLGHFSHAKALTFTVNVPSDITVLIVSNGTDPAPNNISLQWPLDNRTPWSGPLMAGGLLLLLIGIGLYIWAVVHHRRSRGPRRKTPKMPKVPRQRGYRQRRAVSSTAGRRSIRRKMVVATPVLLVGTLLLSGCSSELWPEFLGGAHQATPSPSPTTAAPAGEKLDPPAVSIPQLKEIVARISTVATEADKTNDPTLAATRFTGAALALRSANYAIRKVDNTVPALFPIPATAVGLTLPQATDAWPRTVFTVVQNPQDKTVPPVALMLVQDTARDDYKVNYAVQLEAKVDFPKVSAANIGASPVSPDSKLLKLAPQDLALDYGDILDKGTASPFTKDFDLTADKFISSFGNDYRKATAAALPATAAMTVANGNGTNPVIALSTNDSGAIVATELEETVTVKPNEAGAAVNPEGQVKTLSGITGSTKGTVSVYGDQLLFYVPKAGTKGKITLLGFASGLISAKELP
ncbi:hypothetical protein [Lacisediminihabitans changchengi]|uniref:DUF8094 domain-containing protein n=1 Tax=Lacisediminihabitans changchengi TaxID=2787634 RepID=A0A934SGE1_9MICO|nr:hypothetical protein [Lacisediminihabitans changchengi]MBK4346146.1 hypothetical protein [Lacisediminihabitans changchengi]